MHWNFISEFISHKNNLRTKSCFNINGPHIRSTSEILSLVVYLKVCPRPHLLFVYFHPLPMRLIFLYRQNFVHFPSHWNSSHAYQSKYQSIMWRLRHFVHKHVELHFFNAVVFRKTIERQIMFFNKIYSVLYINVLKFGRFKNNVIFLVVHNIFVHISRIQIRKHGNYI